MCKINNDYAIMDNTYSKFLLKYYAFDVGNILGHIF